MEKEVCANIYTKLQIMRVALQRAGLKKSGKNKFVGYDYFELADFLPTANELMMEYKVCSVLKYTADAAILTLINAEDPQDTIEFTSPMAEATLKGAHPIQNLGAVETYQRRYLYMTAFEIVEADALDMSQKPKEQPKEQPKEKKQVEETTQRERVIRYCNEHGIPLKTVAEKYGLNRNTTEERYAEILREITK